MTFVDVGPLEAFRVFEPTLVRPEGRRVAVVRLPDVRGVPDVRAFDDACPHAADPLSRGISDGSRIMCRAHGWSFDLDSGACVGGDRTSYLPLYAVRLRDGRIEIDAAMLRAEPEP